MNFDRYGLYVTRELIVINNKIRGMDRFLSPSRYNDFSKVFGCFGSQQHTRIFLFVLGCHQMGIVTPFTE